MAVFVLGVDNLPLMPCSEKRARLLLQRARAYVVRLIPFVIKMKDRSQENCKLQELEVKIDPGSVKTGFCLAQVKDKTINVLNLIELKHRSGTITLRLRRRSMYRRNRRWRTTRYRESRFLNRSRSKKWLAPSLLNRIQTTISWAGRFCKWAPITQLCLELVKFDTQKLQNKYIEGKEYQRGTLFNFELKEYLFEKYNYRCMYCDQKEHKLQIEHIYPVALGGSNRVSNLGLACENCNRKKGNTLIDVYLKNDKLRLSKIELQLKKSLRDVAAVNSTRVELQKQLKQFNIPLRTASGALTKHNRNRLNIPKTHALDAACIGELANVVNWKKPHLAITSMGRGRYQRTMMNSYGFPKAYLMKNKKAFGFQTGDICRITKGKSINAIGRITINKTGNFTFTIGKTNIHVNYKNIDKLQSSDGYGYRKANYSFLTNHQINWVLGSG